MNETILNTLAEVAIALAGFSGVVVAFRLRGTHSWSPTELRVLWFLILDSLWVLFFSLLPFPLALVNWSDDALWGTCNALLGSWFIIGNLLAFRGDRRDRIAQQQITVPVITTILYVTIIAGLAMGIALWLSALDLLVARGQAVYVLGLILQLAFAAVEFLFFIALVSRSASETDHLEADKDKEQVHETINKLVESHYDQRQIQTRLRSLQDASEPPLAPSKFESLEAFLDFNGRKQGHEDSIESLNTEYTSATEQYDQARVALSRALPTNVPLYYTYEGGREELKGQQYEIVNMSSSGEGQIRIAPSPAQP